MELSEKLKAKLTETKNEPNTLKWMDLLQQIGALVIDHQDAIIAALDSSEHKAKCVQFAEDVEKLEDINEEVSFYDRQGEKLCSCFFQGVDYLYVGSDIYTAARKAVEALRAAKEGA